MSPLASLRRLLLEAVVASFLPDRIRRRGGNRRRWRGSRKEKTEESFIAIVMNGDMCQSRMSCLRLIWRSE